MRREFEERGTRLRALNDRGDDSPEGELTDGVLDQLAKYERAKMMERTRRGKQRKAQEGKAITTTRAAFGFDYNATRDGYVINPEHFNEHFKSIFEVHEQVSTRGTINSARFALGAVFVHHLDLLHRHEGKSEVNRGLKPFLKAAC